MIQKGDLITSGTRAEVFHYGSKHIIKLFRPFISSSHIEREAKNTKLVWELGAPAPKMEDVVTIDNRQGIIMEFVNGTTLTHILQRAPYKLKEYAKKFAQVHARLHELSCPQLKDQKQFMKMAIQSTDGRLETAIIKGILEQLSMQSSENVICHNDMHQENIIFTDNGPVILDWQEALSGNPMADVVHTLLVQEHPVPAPILTSSRQYYRLHNQYRKHFAKLYLKEYMQITNTSRSQLEGWMLPVAATRVFTKTSIEEKEWSEKYIRKLYTEPLV